MQIVNRYLRRASKIIETKQNNSARNMPLNLKSKAFSIRFGDHFFRRESEDDNREDSECE